ncbi:MAG TPA: pirin family protein [Stellaceae bacterium]|nr:pirin family protein [Stellaceae bacterium]
MERQIDRIERPVERGPSDQVQAKRTMLRPNAYAEQSPFLHLSEDWFAAPGGFETHPHRGMQTVTLVLGGALRHRDHTGADGVLRPGDVQWMTAGRGVLHSEMPHGRDTAHTLQLWVNLPAAAKMIPARYIDQPLATVPLRRMDGIELRVYAGRSGDIVQPHGSHWPVMFIDIAMEAGRSFAQEIPAQFRAFLYLLEGSVLLGRERRKVSAPAVAWVEPRPDGGDAIDLLAIEAEQPMRGVLFGGLPIHEPVVAYGPFVMNTVDEIRQAFADYQANRLTG